jgi:hypothetical protein
MNPNLNIPPNDWQKEMPKLKQMAAAELMDKVQMQSELFTAAFCEIAIHAWRAKRRMTDRHSGEVKDEHKATFRSIEGILASLESVGFTLRDREGEFYDYGLPEKVVAAEKRAGISREMVVETIRPSIKYGEQLVKPGEIVIAVPEEVAVTAPHDEPPAAPAPQAAE